VRTNVKLNEPGWRGDWCGQASALLLIISLLLPFAQIAFGASAAESTTLRACCRAHGKHRCAMRMSMGAEQSSSPESQSPQLAKVIEKCPYAPGLAASTHGNPLWSYTAGSTELRVDDRRLLTALREEHCGSSRTRDNHKRGPPSFSDIA
jgi:hypothetical protein